MAVCVCKGQREQVYLFPLPGLYHSDTFQSHDLSFSLPSGLISRYIVPFFFDQSPLFFYIILRTFETHGWKGNLDEMLNILRHSVAHTSFDFLSRSKGISWVVWQHLSQVSGVTCMCSAHQSHLLKGWLLGDAGRWFYPSNIALQKRALSTTYWILHKYNTHTNTRLFNPSLHSHTPPRLCFSLCKITVVQVSSGQCDADRQACKKDSQALVFATKIFLVLQLAVLPSVQLWLPKKKKPSSSCSRLHLPEEHRGRRKVLSKMSGKVASSFKGLWMYMAQGFQCLLWDSAAPGEARQEERTRERESGRGRWEEEGGCLDSMPEKRPAALSDFKCPAVWNCGFKRYQSDGVSTTPLILSSSSAYHKTCRLTRSQKHAAQSRALWIPLLPVGH